MFVAVLAAWWLFLCRHACNATWHSPKQGHGEASLPRCGLYRDNKGRWVKTTDFIAQRQQLSRHFFPQDPGQALRFDYVWLPHNCSYHRFTNVSIDEKALQKLTQYRHNRRLFEAAHPGLKPINYSAPLSILFMGDSATRSIICALTRIYSGAENLGPCMNNICGMSKKHREVTIPHIHRMYSVDFGVNLIISFFYVKSFYWRKLDSLMEQVIAGYQPSILIFNTGAWDYYEYSKKRPQESAPPRCHDNETQRISDLRSSSFVNATMWKLSELADRHFVRLLYRNSHHNKRFGALCADEKLEQLVNGSRWELWDNRALSEQVWRNQTYDGFHFDWPVMTYTPNEHRVWNDAFKAEYQQWPGMLALQLAQSLLNALFHNELMS